jgi:NAD-dependent dihydropyrimidine dehydrogenase PreA subunit
MRSDALFIAVEVDDAKLAEVCPVDIFAQAGDGELRIVEENLDECVLCGLCLDATPGGSVRVLRLYDEGAPLQRA